MVVHEKGLPVNTEGDALLIEYMSVRAAKTSLVQSCFMVVIPVILAPCRDYYRYLVAWALIFKGSLFYEYDIKIAKIRVTDVVLLPPVAWLLVVLIIFTFLIGDDFLR